MLFGRNEPFESLVDEKLQHCVSFLTAADEKMQHCGKTAGELLIPPCFGDENVMRNHRFSFSA